MNMTFLHDATFVAMYLSAAVVTLVIVERLIFYGYTMRSARRLESSLTRELVAAGELPGGGSARSLPVAAIRQMVDERGNFRGRDDIEDMTDAIFVATKAKLEHHLWILDTVVTAAPLMGLLGTILGIIDTFTALAQSGISDPQGVAAGIGTALFATALGITIALYGLIFLNHFRDRVERIGDLVKILLLRAAMGVSTVAAVAPSRNVTRAAA
jgi:biopolymer transport protein ExbB